MLTTLLGLLGAVRLVEAKKSGPGDRPMPAKGETYLGSEFVEVLSAESFNEKITKVLNDTESPAPYTPLVMFHMPWCEHCRATIPELEQSAEQIVQASRQGQLPDMQTAPKFFMLSCSEPGAKDICDYHTGSSYPGIIVFRDQRAIRFNRPRMAQVITWWTVRVMMPAVAQVDSIQPYKAHAEHEVVFLIHVRPQDADILEAWKEIALDNLGVYTFFMALKGSDASKSLPAAPSIHVEGPKDMGLAPLPFSANRWDQESLEAWIQFNQFPPISELSFRTWYDIRKSSLTVIVLVHSGGPAGTKAREAFEAKVRELRPLGSYLFAVLTYGDEESKELVNKDFPLLSPAVLPLPRVFAASEDGGSVRYWEDPEMSNVTDLTIASIEALLGNSEALQDSSSGAWFKGKRKIYVRFASQSFITLTVAIVVPILVVAFFALCCRAICSSDDEVADSGKHDHVD